jgi:pimeloyl-ACP methyl ester carboxylesterase
MLINSHHLNVETHGPDSGPPIVLLHHGLGSTRSWRKQVPALAGAGYRVIVYDRWGYGQSEPRPYLEVPSFEDDLADLETILETFELGHVAFLGHSDGGSIALYYAAQNPQRVTALITLAAHIYLEPKMEPGIQSIRKTFEQDEDFRSKLHRVHGDKFESVFYNWFDGWHTPKAQDWDMRPLLSEIPCPALVIQGQEDEHATSKHAQDIAAGIPGAKLWLVPEAAHMLQQEMPELFNKKILEFLRFLCRKTELPSHQA